MRSPKDIGKPLISIIIPVYEVEKYLCKCLDSVIIQDYGYLEIILVDDASPDSSGKICDMYAQQDDRIQVIHLEQNHGISYARNIGILEAKGEFISFVDPDDYLEHNMFEKLYVSMEENQADISICGTNFVGFKKQDYYLKSDFPCVISAKEAVAYMINGWHFRWGISGKLFPCSLAKKYPFIENIHCGEDILFIYQILKHVHRVSYIPDRLYHYIYREDSTTHGKFYFKQYTELYAYELLYKDIKKDNPELLPQIEQKILNINIRLAVKAVESKAVRGRQLYRYLCGFHNNIRRYYNKKALYLFKEKKLAAEVILLYMSAEVFWTVTVLYKGVKKLILIVK